MRKFAFVWAAAAAMSFGLTACGGDTEAPDAAVEEPDAEQIDASIDAPIRGDVEDFDVCVFNDDCHNPDSDCRMTIFQQKWCLPRCADSDSDMCPFSTYCVPTNGGNLGSGGALMGDHCMISICGAANFNNGETGGTCKVGGETYTDYSTLHDGYCYSIDDGQFGQCMEVGTQGTGDPCAFGDQTRDGDNCDATSICLGQTGNPVGTCYQLCDPTTIDDDAATNTGCPASHDCLDWSSVTTYSDGSTAVGTLAVCYEDVVACHTIGANICPDDPTSGDPRGCGPSNDVRATGVCDTGFGGELAAGASCPDDPTGPAQQCDSGTLCAGPDAASRTCMTTCDIVTSGTPVIDCATIDPTYTCQSLWWDNGFDKTDGTADDNYTAGWGLCGPPPA